ncbi:histidine phosphatase family protein [Inconstantimicrobium porci]|uniref:histidine phosphatase family protein n=1 Tax=Inconstantimicrobium porci TaxID=2652291 RepID=UPI002409BB43|nr:histidine phosphatase family protein [Inconstantimicrobium porci]MDD6769886.1 histidine phosphatase family protein [Inconstantimicrobium porci]
MITKLLLIRHGETEWNALGKFQGSKNIDLSHAGIKQAGYLKERLDGAFDCIYTSPLNRAQKTAEILCSDMNISPIVTKNLREIDFGEWEGLTIDEIKNIYGKEFALWRNDEINAPLCGGEQSIKLASIRAKRCVLDIVNNNKGKTIAIVAHGGIIKATILGIFDLKMTMYHKITLGNTAISEIHFNENNEAKIVTLNDTSHLPKDMEIKSYV